MRTIAVVLVLVGLGIPVSACGGDDDGAAPTREAARDATREPAPDTTREPAADAAEPDTRERPKGTTLATGESEFGPMLFDSRKQAIYIFENDRPNASACYGECAEAWPPVYTDGAPRAGDGVDAALLGTIERRDGRRQVTYAGKPLYFYAHESAGEVRCHNVDLNGGFWWVIGPDGDRRPA